MARGRSTWRVIGAVVIGLGLLAGIAVSGAKVLVESEWGRTKLAAALSQHLGRDVDIAGIDVEPGRWLQVRVRDVAVANADWAARPYLARVDDVAVVLDPLALVSDAPVLRAITLHAPRVNLERAPDGTVNWAAASTAASDRADDAGAGGIDALPLDVVAVHDGRVTWRDPARSTSIDLVVSSRDGGSAGSSAPTLGATGSGRILGEPAELRLDASAPAADGTLPLDMRVASGDLLATVTGQVGGMPGADPAATDLRLRIDGDSLGRFNPLTGFAFDARSPYTLSARVRRDGTGWLLRDLEARVAGSDLGGELSVAFAGGRPALTARLRSERLDLARLLDALAPAPQATPPRWPRIGVPVRALDWLRSPPIAGRVAYHADRVATGDTPLRDVAVTVDLGRGELRLDPLRARAGQGGLSAALALRTVEDGARGTVTLSLDALSAATLRAASPATSAGAPLAAGTFDGDLELAFQLQAPVPTGDDAADGTDLVVTSLRPGPSALTWRAAAGATQLTATLDPAAAPGALTVAVDGTLRDAPLRAEATVPPLDAWLLAGADTPDEQDVAVTLAVADAHVAVSGAVAPAWPPPSLTLTVEARDPTPARTADVTGLMLPVGAPIAVSAQIAKDGTRWQVDALELQAAGTRVDGSTVVTTGSELTFDAELHARRLDVDALRALSVSSPRRGVLTAANQDGPRDRVDDTTGLPSWLARAAGEIRLQVDRLQVAGTAVDGIDTTLTVDDGTLSAGPTDLALHGGTLTLALQADLAAAGGAGRLQANLSGLDVARALARPRDEPLGNLDGSLTLNLAAGQATDPAPLAQRLRLDELRLRYDDPDRDRRSDLRLTAPSLDAPMRIAGTLGFDSDEVALEAHTGSLREAVSDWRALPLQLTAAVDDTRIDVETTVARLLPPSELSAALRLQGSDTAELGAVLDIPLPSLPPFDLRATLRREAAGGRQRWILDDLDGVVGDSDVAGTLRVETGGARPALRARLRSRRLDIDDLGGTIGLAPDPDETASREQRAVARQREASPRLFASRPLDIAQLRRMDADVVYRATRVNAPRLPLDDLAIDLTLDDARLRFTRLDFGVATGTVALQGDLDARGDSARLELAGDFEALDLDHLITADEAGDDAYGMIGGRVKLWLRGNSVAQWAASADGGAFLTMTGGRLDTLLVELAGLDVIESAAVFLGPESELPIECAYADLQARDGIVHADPLLFDTRDTKFEGRGTIDLRDERLDLTVIPRPKDFTLLSMRGPLEVRGRLKAPRFEVNPTFPTPEFGLADDAARCGGLVEALRRARKGGARADAGT